MHSDGFTMCRPMLRKFLNIEQFCEGRIYKMKTKTFGEIGASSLNNFARALDDWISWNNFIIFRPKVQGDIAFLIFMYTAAFFFFFFFFKFCDLGTLAKFSIFWAVISKFHHKLNKIQNFPIFQFSLMVQSLYKF